MTNVTNPIEDLEEQLRIAIDEQNFEKAAELRDRINELKAGGKNE